MNSSETLLAEAQRYGYTEAGRVWLRPVLGQPARPIGLVKDSEEEALIYFARRFAAFEAKTDDLLDRMAGSDNKGSYLMKAQHLRGGCRTHDGLGDYTWLDDQLATAEAGVAVSVGQNRAKNLAFKGQLLDQAQTLHDTVEWMAAGEQVKELRKSWLQTGPVDKDLTEDLENRFQTALQLFFDRRKEYQVNKKVQASRALIRYRELLAEAEKLKISTAFETASRQLKQLQTEWREVKGSINKRTAAELWTKFRAANNLFFERLKTHIENQQFADGGPPASPDELLARKRRLTVRIEALTRVPPAEAVPQAKLLQAEWKKVGTVRGEESDQLWNRFMVACDRIFELSALEYFVRKSFNGQPETGTVAARAQARVAALIEFLAADRTEVAQLQTNLDALAHTTANDGPQQVLQVKIRSLERKIRAKNDLLADFSYLATTP